MTIQLRRGRGESASLYIWEYPEPGSDYFIGGDAARGVEDGDFAGAVGFNGNTGEQAFTFSARQGVEPFAQTLYLLATFYNKAMLNVEQTGGDGAQVMKILRDRYRYSKMAPWRGRDDKRHTKPSMTIGWETNWKSRQRLLVVFRQYVGAGDVIIRDKRIVSQMGNAVRDDPMIRWEVLKGHDDLFMAAAIAVIAMDQWPPPRRHIQSKNLLQPKDEDSVYPLPFESEPAQRLKDKWRTMQGLEMPRAGDPLEGI